MTILIENDFRLDNHITISNQIKTIPIYSSYFFPIISYKNLDENHKIIKDCVVLNDNENIHTRDIPYKLIYFPNYDFTLYNFHNSFGISLYHTFLSVSILHDHNISYTVNHDSFIRSDKLGINNVLLHNFSNSFYFNMIHFDNLRDYFSLSLLDNPYIPIDVFIITYIIHTNTSTMSNNEIDSISELFYDGREKINKNSIFIDLSYLLNFSSQQVIKYLFQFKHTWSYHSLAYYFILHYPTLLTSHNLYDTFYQYINSTITERNPNIIADIHDSLFIR